LSLVVVRMKPQSTFRRKLFITLGVIGLVLILGIAFVISRLHTINERTRMWVERTLSDRFQSKVELGSLYVTAFPQLSVIGEDLNLRHHNREDVPPLIQIKKFSFELGLMGLFRAPRHIQRIRLENMTITIPPRGTEPVKPEKADKKGRETTSVIVDEIVCNDTDLITLPKKVGKVPLDWDIHDLVLHSVGANKPFSFKGNLTNAKPIGEIATTGKFGPWEADDPGSTLVTGSYDFTNADLAPFPGIAGTLSSKGDYTGALNRLEVKGETDTPNFSLDISGRGVPLHTEYSATVDGTNGDTLLHPVRATLIHSLIIAEGGVVKMEGKEGKLITLDVVTPNARIEDILRLAISKEPPIMTGPVDLKTKFILPPGKQKAVDKLILDGTFGIKNAQWGNAEIRKKLESLSRHGKGEPENEDAGSSVSNLKGRFHLEKGTIDFHNLTFEVPGAMVALDGTYQVRSGELDFRGHLRLDAKLSQTMTGAKSFFLKMFDPFFKKDGAGAVVPIKITGTREEPKFGLALFGGGKNSRQ
jgi:hypothetical protein